MKRSILLGTLTAAALAAGAAGAATLDDVKGRGMLNCGVNTGLAGFAAPDANGNWQGFDIAICKAVAAAVLGDPTQVKYVPTTAQNRFDVLTSGAVDLLARNSSWSFEHDTRLKLDFVATNYYDGQGFMVPKSLGVTSVKELDGATICVQTGTTTALNLEDWFKANNMSFQRVSIDSSAEGERQYLAGACDAYTTDASGLAATRAAFANPDDHVILPEIISKEPLGPAVRHGDSQWADIVSWAHFAMLIGEEKGITSANVDDMKAKNAEGTDGADAEVQRLLGITDKLGEGIGLGPDWAYNILKQVGNYGEAFERNVGKSSPLGLDRGLNALWTQGGLQYAAPFR